MLYRQFKLDEAWDSPHNKPLLAQIPKTYLLPDQTSDGTGSTYYQVCVGKGTLFESRDTDPKLPSPAGGIGPYLGYRFVDVTDGLSNTILVATARNAVPWTKPDDIVFDPVAGVPVILGGHQPGGFSIAFGDGSVRWVQQNIPEQTIRAMITRNGGEMVPPP
jgi:hypothetical protein